MTPRSPKSPARKARRLVAFIDVYMNGRGGIDGHDYDALRKLLGGGVLATTQQPVRAKVTVEYAPVPPRSRKSKGGGR